jgi:hypothetical protein
MAAFVSINLPETANEQLPETIEEAEEFGKDQVCMRINFFSSFETKSFRLD